MICEGGLAGYTPTGTLAFTYKMKEPNVGNSEKIGSTFFMANEDALVALDLENGSERGKYTYMKGFRYGIKQEGKSFFMLGEKKTMKYLIE